MAAQLEKETSRREPFCLRERLAKSCLHPGPCCSLLFQTIPFFLFPPASIPRLLSKTLFSSTAGLGSLWGHDLALHRHPPAPVVFQQEEVRYSQTQEELNAVFLGPSLPRNQVFSRLQRVSKVFSWPLARGYFVLNLTPNSTRMRGAGLEVGEGLPVVTEAI